MDITKSFYWTTLLSLFYSIECELLENYFLFIPGKRFVKNILEEDSSVNYFECIRKCLENSGCKGIAWNSLGKTCQLGSNDITHEIEVKNKMVDDPAYLAYGKSRFPVYFVQNEGRNNLAFEDAGEKCRSKGSLIASSSEILKAEEAGMEKCICGWIAEGINVAVAQSGSINCEHVKNSDGLNECGRSKAAVWCLF